MMYITFVDNNIIPEHLTDFYEAAYDALYKRHDANKDEYLKEIISVKNWVKKNLKIYFRIFVFNHILCNNMNLIKRKFLNT